MVHLDIKLDVTGNVFPFFNKDVVLLGGGKICFAAAVNFEVFEDDDLIPNTNILSTGNGTTNVKTFLC